MRLLQEVGFSSAVIEPKTMYTREVLREKAQRKGRMARFERIAGQDVDAKTGSVIVVAQK